jgi:hypothetical protein
MIYLETTAPAYKTVVYPFGQYMIKLRLTLDNRFIDIEEVKLNKDFATYKQKMASVGSWDVQKYYDEE